MTTTPDYLHASWLNTALVFAVLDEIPPSHLDGIKAAVLSGELQQRHQRL